MYIELRRKMVAVASLEEASAKWCALRDECNKGVRALGNGLIVFSDDHNPIARISYNGRIWPVYMMPSGKMLDYFTSLKTADEAKAFIRMLHANDKLFHFDDSPETIIDDEGNPLFDKDTCKHLSVRVAELFKLLNDDPFEYALDVLNGLVVA